YAAGGPGGRRISHGTQQRDELYGHRQGWRTHREPDYLEPGAMRYCRGSETDRRPCRVLDGATPGPSKGETAMRLRWFTIAGAAAVAAAGALGVDSTSVAAPSTPKPSEQSLRALGERHGLYVGTAVDMQALNDLADPQYRELVASQFSTVTAENVMKWELLEPTRGTYDWKAA